MKPLLSIIILSSDRIDLLKITIASLISRIGYLPWEMIVYNHQGSHEEGLIKLINQAKGKYLLNCEDDWFFIVKSGWVEKAIAMLDEHSEIGMVKLRRDEDGQHSYKVLEKINTGFTIEDWGYSNNPFIARTSDIQKVLKNVKEPLKLYIEQKMNASFKETGLRIAKLTGWTRNGTCIHTGWGRNVGKRKWNGAKKLPLLSIIINATPDREDFLQFCITSLLNSMTYPHFELLVYQHPSNQLEGWMHLMSLVQGEYLLNCEDDYLFIEREDWVQQGIKLLDKNPEIGIIRLRKDNDGQTGNRITKELEGGGIVKSSGFTLNATLARTEIMRNAMKHMPEFATTHCEMKVRLGFGQQESRAIAKLTGYNRKGVCSHIGWHHPAKKYE